MKTMMKGCPELRAELNRLAVPPKDAGLEWLDIQIREVAALNDRYPHGIAVETRSSNATAELNCFMCAFDLQADAIRDMVLGQVFPGSEFAVEMMRGSLRAKSESDATINDIVIYIADGAPKHAGKISAADRIISKWGAGRTHIWKHGLWEVPAAYGDKVLIFQPASREVAVRAYLVWAESRGL